MKELIEKAIKLNEELGAKLKELEELEEPNLLGAEYFDKESMSWKIKEIVKPDKPNNPEVGDIFIFWDDNKSNAIIGKLTKINYKSIWPYEVTDLLEYKNCIPFQSMEQYNKFIEE